MYIRVYTPWQALFLSGSVPYSSLWLHKFCLFFFGIRMIIELGRRYIFGVSLAPLYEKKAKSCEKLRKFTKIRKVIKAIEFRVIQ